MKAFRLFADSAAYQKELRTWGKRRKERSVEVFGGLVLDRIEEG
jgi:hypothetical protein